MNRLLRSRIVRLAYPVVAPATEGAAVAERSPAEGAARRPDNSEPRSLPHKPALRRAEEPALLALSEREGSAAEGSGARGNKAQRPALRQAERLALSEGERARRPHPGRHARICSICRHPSRDAIEEAFIYWHSPSDIAIDYHLPDRNSVYRHAHATGLFARRSRNLRFVLERLLERVDKVKVTAHAVVRAVRAYTRLNDAGDWVEPPTRIIVSSGSPSAARSSVYTERSERALPASTEHAQRALRARARPSERIPGKARAKPRSNRHRRPQSR